MGPVRRGPGGASDEAEAKGRIGNDWKPFGGGIPAEEDSVMSGVYFAALEISKDSFQPTCLLRITGHNHRKPLQFGRTQV